jgi:hypothetical protein
MVLAYDGEVDGASTMTRACYLALVLLLASGCRTPQEEEPRSPVTAGMVKMSVTKGETTQTEVLEIFGPPDLLTYQDGTEVWTYDKTTYEIERKSGYFTVLLAGSSSKEVRSASVSSMVIIYFDANEVVRDYRISIVKY